MREAKRRDATVAHHIADIGRQAGEIESTALAQAEAGCTIWLSPEQEHLGICMEGMRIPLSGCHALARPVGPVLLAASVHEREGLVAQMAAAAAEEVEQRPGLYAPVMDPLADIRSDGTMAVSDRQDK